jgi:hypothetical protein
MKKILFFIDTWGFRITTTLVLFIFLKTCNTNSKIKNNSDEILKTQIEISKLNKKIDSLTIQLKKEIKIEGLKSEKRMIQSTDRKIFDVNRQTEIDKEIQSLGL